MIQKIIKGNTVDENLEHRVDKARVARINETARLKEGNLVGNGPFVASQSVADAIRIWDWCTARDRSLAMGGDSVLRRDWRWLGYEAGPCPHC